MTISISHLTHKATLSRRTAGAKDAYGKITYVMSNFSINCFFDMINDKEEVGRKYLGSQDQTITAVAIMFTEPNANIRLGDEISSILDINNTVVNNNFYKIVEIRPSLDEIGVHHLEVYITTSK